MTIVRFTRHSGYTYYYTDWDSNMSGEYVPLAEYLELKRSFNDVLKETNDSWNQTANSACKTGEVIEHVLEGKITELKALIQHINDIGDELYDRWREDEASQSEELKQLLKDIREML